MPLPSTWCGPPRPTGRPRLRSPAPADRRPAWTASRIVDLDGGEVDGRRARAVRPAGRRRPSPTPSTTGCSGRRRAGGASPRYAARRTPGTGQGAGRPREGDAARRRDGRSSPASMGCDPDHGPIFAVIGVFDGLHRGHAYLLEHLVRRRVARIARPCVITFDHHPDEVLDRLGAAAAAPPRRAARTAGRCRRRRHGRRSTSTTPCGGRPTTRFIDSIRDGPRSPGC